MASVCLSAEDKVALQRAYKTHKKCLIAHMGNTEFALQLQSKSNHLLLGLILTLYHGAVT